MNTKRSRMLMIPILFLIGPLLVLAQPDPAYGAGSVPQNDLELAQLYAPVLYFHPAEVFRPQSVDVMVNSARLRRAQRNWFDVNVLTHVAQSDLFKHKDENYYLDAWLGDRGASDYKNYSTHRAYYQSDLSPEVGGPPIVAYAHVVRNENPEFITIQYWLFYYYNDWFNKHEGDWELVQVVLQASGKPEWVALSQHHGGTRRDWEALKVENGTHPAVYVAYGSHANYFWGDEIYPNGTKIGNIQIEIMDRTGTAGRIIPEVILIPDPQEIEQNPLEWTGLEWVSFLGRWGEIAPQSDFSGPIGPTAKGLQWEQPYAWGMNTSMDLNTWYKNRLRVELKGRGAENAKVTLRPSDGRQFNSAESSGRVSILHVDPPSDVSLLAEIEAEPNSIFQVSAIWPDAANAEVTEYLFSNVAMSYEGRAVLTFGENVPPKLVVEGHPIELSPSSVKVQPATWDAEDLIWVAGVLPASDVIKGVGVSLLAGLIPSYLFAAILYLADRYEKEPFRLIAAAFYWGAWPAVLIAIVTQVFLKLPADILGPDAIEAVRAGLIAPLIEETIKGAALLVIAIRYRREFDDVLDGIIYGAITGFGFAMTGNTISYVGAFLLRGFSGLSNMIFLEGIIYGLNHGLYSALFGAGLGFAREAKKKWQRRFAPPAAFLLAVTVHALHSYALRNALGLNLFSITLTLLGMWTILVIMTWSIRREQRCLKAELEGEISDDLYRTLTERGGRRRAQFRAMQKDGLRGLRHERRIHQLCAELAFKKKLSSLRPEETDTIEETVRLRDKLHAMMSSSAAA
jgi:RsiW-degrading membrane proteinase PrsW (M82 family)